MSARCCHVSPLEKPRSRVRGPGALFFALALSFGATAVLRADPLLTSDFTQGANNDTTGSGLCLPVPDCEHWIGSIVQASNAIYREGQTNPQRVVFDQMTPSVTHTLTFSHQFTKGGVHAYDFLTGYYDAQNEVDSPPFSPFGITLNECGENITATLVAMCTALHGAPVPGYTPFACPGPAAVTPSPSVYAAGAARFVDLPIPDDGTDGILPEPTIVDPADGSLCARIQAYELATGCNRTIRIISDKIITDATLSYSLSGSTAGDSDLDYVLTWTTSTASTQVIIEMGGHLAKTGGPGDPGSLAACGGLAELNDIAWGPGQGSSQISGGPYHFNLKLLDNNAIGSQDNQIKGADIINPDICGDGVINGTPPETCDGGDDATCNLAGSCRITCTCCGDGTVDTGETCDETAAGTLGCSAAGSGATDACRANCTCCGDGTVDTGEACDDGNTVDTDGCRNNCTLPICGDGLINLTPPEACDGAARRTGVVCNDACDAQCTCCGDGIVQSPETCDDGNAVDTDGCRNNCTLPICGDGLINLTPPEACDGAARRTGVVCSDACDAVCTCCGDAVRQAEEPCDGSQFEPSAPSSHGTCRSNCTYCGDGDIQTPETCDDGNAVDTDGCRNNCTLPICGDGLINLTPPEACDGAARRTGVVCSDACDAQCTCCGDGAIQSGEACDGAAHGSCVDGCAANCTCTPVCGDNHKDASEQCDGTDDAACPGECRSDCTCPPIVPAVGAWGLGGLALLLLSGVAIKFGRRRAAT